MAIRIVRNEAGNCINFFGSSNPTYWNACLSGEVDSVSTDSVNVINDIITAQTGETQYEFFRIPYTEFTDADGNAFADAQAAADYITEKANVIGLSGEGIDLIGQTVCFSLDATNTSIMVDNGYSYGVNTIKANPDADGTIHIVSNDGADDITHFYNLEVGNACIGGETVLGGLNDVANALNELFTVGSLGTIVVTDPFSTLVADVAGLPAGYTLEGSTVVDPVGSDLATNSSSSNYAGILSVATISNAGEYFTFDIRGEGQIGFGLVHTQESYDDGKFSGNSSYADPSSFAVGNSAHYGFQFSHWFHPTPNGSWTNYGANTSYVMGYQAWSQGNWNQKQDWLDGNPVKMKVGLDANGFISIESLQDDGSWILHARTSYNPVEGSEFKLGVKFANSSPRLYSAPKVHLLDSAQAPTALGTDAITVFGEGITGTIAGGISSSATDGLDNDGFVSTQAIDAVGEYFEFTWSAGGDANFGLFSENDHDVSDLTSDTTAWGNDDYIFYGARAEDSGVMTAAFREGGEAYTSVGSGNDPATCQYYGRVGFDGQGRATVWFSVDGTNWSVFHHGQAAAPSGDYKFIWIAQEDGCVLDTLEQGVIETAPVMNFRYAESPDGVYKSPLFATAEEAEYYDSHEGGSGTYTTLQLPDDPTNTVWYVPDTEYTGNGIAAPVGQTFEGNLVLYTEITTLANADLVPPAFTDASITVNELSAVNYQLSPVDVGYTTTIGGIPNWSLVDGTTLQGTAPEVTGDNVTNPSDTTTVTVYRTNVYGTSQGTLTINIINLTAPVVTAITGFTHNASSTALEDSDTMASGSVVDMDEDLLDLERLVVLDSFVEANVLPSLQQAGDKYYMGVLNSGADVSSVEDADWDVAFVWEYQTATTHQYRVIKDGVQQHHTGIGSNTVALFDYAIEAHDGHLYMIADSQSGINTEPSSEFGGTFSKETQVALNESYPLKISLAYVGSANAKFAVTGLSEIVTPAPSDWIQVTANPSHTLQFDGSGTMPTLQAGYTYRFLMGDTVYADLSTNSGLHADDDLRFTADGSTEYTTGITRVGDPNDTDTFGAHTAYVEFAVPSDVPPLQWYTDHNAIGSATGVNISGSSYVTPVTGVTQEGPVANQTGSNLFDQGDQGWISIDEQLSAGERIVMDGAFLYDLVDAMPDNSDMYIGLKDASWTDAYSTAGFEGNAYFYVARYSSSNVKVQASASTSTNAITTTVPNMAQFGAFIDLTNSGNNIRLGFTYNGDGSSDDEGSTAYGDWGTARKVQTGDQGYGLTSVDVMVMGSGNLSGNAAGMDSADVDWTALSEINVPSPAVTNLTSWSKALDFSGSSERAEQVGTNTNYMPIGMDGLSATASGHATPGYTSGHIYSRPWACSVVFSADGNNSNQHIWNMGEGAGSTDDNIYLRLSSTRQLFFGWGRDGALNELYIGTITANRYYGIYIGFTGERLSGADATGVNLSQCFDVRLMSEADSFASSSDQGTAAEWNNTGYSTIGGRMDRSVTSKFSIGGRGANRNFHGKIASFVCTTLRINQPMPTVAEAELMITDPVKWLNDYKDGNTYRVASSQAEATFGLFSYLSNSAFATQVWLMGDGTLDNYSNMIRNQVYPQDQNYTKLNMISMVSNDIQNVTISGLS